MGLVVICMMAAMALTDMAVLPSPGDDWRVLLRLAVIGAYVVAFLAAILGAFLFLRRLF